MKSTIIAAAMLAALTTAIPLRQTKRDDLPTADAIAIAVSKWQADTAAVSQFLNIAPTFRTAFGDNEPAFKLEAQVALNSELDELLHKGVLDTFFVLDGTPSDITSANTTLVDDGTFQQVVDKLQDMATNGFAALDAGDVDAINANRCARVLPAIDAYFQSIESFLSDSEDVSADVAKPSGGAVRPAACGGPADLSGQFGL
ncbi:hypothetical protein H2203_008892 [Taxawa tesnikishii (nom. ined.)]|nr:hypothetical protein H2203_008892 [Dothideales sp. JES 119]